jgi:hypothetical protein
VGRWETNIVSHFPEFMLAGRMDRSGDDGRIGRGGVRHRPLQSLVCAKRWRWMAARKTLQMAFGSSIPIGNPNKSKGVCEWAHRAMRRPSRFIASGASPLHRRPTGGSCQWELPKVFMRLGLWR